MSVNLYRPILFLSYSHKDEADKEALVTHLRVLQSTGMIDLWVDDRIGAGTDWLVEIEKAINQAQVAILLVTAHFLTSNFILYEEIPRLLKRRRDEGLVILPVIARDCAWESVEWLAQMQVRPKNGNPVWSEVGRYPDKVLADIAREALDIITKRSSFDSDRRPVKRNITSPTKPITKHSDPTTMTNGEEIIIILKGEFAEFNVTRQQWFVSVLAAILGIDEKYIRVLQVYEGSIVMVIEMPKTAANRLHRLVTKQDFSIGTLGILSVRIGNGETLVVSGIDNAAEATVTTRPTKSAMKAVSGQIRLLGEVAAGRGTQGEELVLYASDESDITVGKETIPFLSTEANIVALRVRGTSMERDGILDGDYLIVELSSDLASVKEGQMIVAKYLAKEKELYAESNLDDLDFIGPTLKIFGGITTDYKGRKYYRLGWSKGNEENPHTILTSGLSLVGIVREVHRTAKG